MDDAVELADDGKRPIASLAGLCAHPGLAAGQQQAGGCQEDALKGPGTHHVGILRPRRRFGPATGVRARNVAAP
jgi:hypothetical protein